MRRKQPADLTQRDSRPRQTQPPPTFRPDTRSRLDASLMVRTATRGCPGPAPPPRAQAEAGGLRVFRNIPQENSLEQETQQQREIALAARRGDQGPRGRDNSPGGVSCLPRPHPGRLPPAPPHPALRRPLGPAQSGLGRARGGGRGRGGRVGGAGRERGGHGAHECTGPLPGEAADRASAVEEVAPPNRSQRLPARRVSVGFAGRGQCSPWGPRPQSRGRVRQLRAREGPCLSPGPGARVLVCVTGSCGPPGTPPTGPCGSHPSGDRAPGARASEATAATVFPRRLLGYVFHLLHRHRPRFLGGRGPHLVFVPGQVT